MNKHKLAGLSPEKQLKLYTRYSGIIRDELNSGVLMEGMLTCNLKEVRKHLRRMNRVKTRMTRLWQVMDRAGVSDVDFKVWGRKEWKK